MIEDIANAMVARLADQFEGFTAEHFPDKNALEELAKKKPGFFVNYDASNFSDPMSAAPMSSDEQMKFVVTLRVLGLRGPKGAMNILPLLRKCFFGWVPTKDDAELGVTKFLPVDSGFVGETEGVWRFAMTFKTTKCVVEDLAATTWIPGVPAPGPLFKDVILKDPDPE